MTTFHPSASLPGMPEIPEVPLHEFMFDEKHGRRPFAESLDAYTCGISGRKITAIEQKQNVDNLSKALAGELDWRVNEGSEFDKVIGIFALNTVDIMTLSWATHRLGGCSSPANAMYSADELKYHLKTSQCKALFTVESLLPVALEAVDSVGIPRNKVYICETPADQRSETVKEFQTLSQLINKGKAIRNLEQLKWAHGQAERQTAFLSYSSGTSGLPKAVMISHKNVMANIIQLSLFDQYDRDSVAPGYRDVGLGLLPQSHIYSLIVICHTSTYRGDSVIVLPKFDLDAYLTVIQRYKINTLYLVPPIVISMINNFDKMKKFDLSSVRRVWVGAAPMPLEATRKLLSKYPDWQLTLGWGMTETCVAVTSTSPQDIWLGSSGCILPGFEVILIDEQGERVTAYNKPGEVLVKSPTVVIGYKDNEVANRETFIELPEGRFIKTGDIGEVRKAPSGNEHIWIVDRIKELIKVKGHQVAPAELEALLIGHPAVADCAVIAVPDDRAGEVPKAFVVQSQPCSEQDLIKFVETKKARHKWLKGGVEFVESIPKSPSGKILRRLLRDSEKQRRKSKL